MGGYCTDIGGGASDGCRGNLTWEENDPISSSTECDVPTMKDLMINVKGNLVVQCTNTLIGNR